jgi:hypothetical protein
VDMDAVLYFHVHAICRGVRSIVPNYLFQGRYVLLLVTSKLILNVRYATYV